MKSEWIAANAGSGKTYTLTQRVVALLLHGVTPERIVCITYTKAAANEMRERVLSALRTLLLASEADTAGHIATALGHPPDAAQMQLAKSLFGRVLDSPSGGVQITTIHGFCQNLLRQFPLEADIAPHFTVLEEAAADEVLAQTKHSLLAGLQSADDWLRNALALLGERGGEYRFEEMARDSISKRRFWEEIWRGQSPESLRARLWALHGLEPDDTSAALNAWLMGCITAEAEAIIRDHLPLLLAHATAKYRTYGQVLTAWLVVEEGKRLPLIAPFTKLFVTLEGTTRKDLLSKAEYAPTHPFRLVMEGIAPMVERYVTKMQGLACAEESLAVAIMARNLLDGYAQAKATRHALDYDDLIEKTLQLVSQPETLGWVMSRLDHRIDHLLIDEAQDNSAAQWHISRILVEELVGYAGELAHHALPRSVLVVGDEKQSIYSFQGAAPEQFGQYREVFAQLLSESATGFHMRALSNSYRSANAVLVLVNHVCAQPLIGAAIQASGESPPHQLIRTNACGRVVLYPPVGQVQAPSKPEPMVMPTQYQFAQRAPQLLANEMAETIHRWLVVEQRQLVSEGRALQAGDILILVHKRSPMVQPLIRALQRLGVPVAGLDRLKLADHLAVKDILALMDWCLNNADDLALAQVLRSPLIGMSDGQLRAHAFGRAGTLWAAIQDPWLEQVRAWRHDSPYDFLTQVLEVSGKRRDFARRFGEEIHEILDELKAQAASMPAGIAPSTANFHALISNSTRSIKREQEAGTSQLVRIMTVHGAKGLEAPVVLLADTVSVPNTGKERFFTAASAHGQLLPLLSMSTLGQKAAALCAAKEQKKQALLAEYLRLLYVAITRPRDELHVFGIANAKGEVPADSWYHAVRASMQALAAAEMEGRLELTDAPPNADVENRLLEVLMTAPVALPAWLHQPVLASSIPASLSPSSVAQAPRWQQVENAGQTRGVRIHRVLEWLHAESTPVSIRRLIAYVAPDWSAAEQEQAFAELQRLHAQEAWLWQHERMAEVSIAGMVEHEGAQVPISGQIDVLIQTPTEMIVIDYKTGSHVPADVNAVPESYVRQLAIYRALVRQIYPHLPVRSAILWTHTAQLMWVGY